MKKTLLSILTFLAISISVTAQIPTYGLVGQYNFNAGALTDNINNVSFTKTGTNATNIRDRFGNVNSAISLNGDDLRRTDIDFDATTSNPFLPRTISFWLKTSTNDGYSRYLYNDSDQVDGLDFSFNGMSVALKNGVITLLNRVGTNGTAITHPTVISDNKWHHIAIQASSIQGAGNQKSFVRYIFIDGVKVGGSGYNARDSRVTVRANEHVGNISFSGFENAAIPSNTKYQDGIDDILFYTRTLADSEIIAMAAPPCTVNIPDANFKAYLVGNVAINTNGDTEIQCTEATAFTGQINCSSLSISDLTGIEAFTEIIYLLCDNNSLSSLDVSNNINLKILNCSQNLLSSLDVSNNTSLTTLYCQNNSLSSLDVSNNISLTKFTCGSNSLSSLDVSNNTNLNTFASEGNLLTSLNVANGNNSNFRSFYANSNPNLTCIQVDDVAYSTTNWTNIDATASFSTNCSLTLVSSISVQGKSGVTTINAQGGTLLMAASISPSNADDKTYTWSVVNGTGSATINTSGLLTALTDGTVDVIATANDGSGVTGRVTITILNQTLGINEVITQNVTIYPNPVKNQLFVELNNQQITKIEIIDYSGRVLKTITNNNTKSIDVSDLAQGVYLLKVTTNKGISTNRFIKQ